MKNGTFLKKDLLFYDFYAMIITEYFIF